ncbi:hypothetical protein HLPCO_002936 [Haloplasma contractile SSD-17B]|uniref:Uncharacterized protein n=1 Tax=Haloplasma contractile SSD-17B TaxID=1033810 RepID=U2FDJ5_9MOLU|nr:hypothetical protein HLPCO_002936 [Haloplasma contractile SSD-17B]
MGRSCSILSTSYIKASLDLGTKKQDINNYKIPCTQLILLVLLFTGRVLLVALIKSLMFTH